MGPGSHGIINLSQGPMNYQTYLRSEHWRLLSGAKRQMSSKCERCGSKHELEVHHKRYGNDWFAVKISDLETLCHHCHVCHHAIGGDQQRAADLAMLEASQREPEVTPWALPIYPKKKKSRRMR